MFSFSNSKSVKAVFDDQVGQLAQFVHVERRIGHLSPLIYSVPLCFHLPEFAVARFEQYLHSS